MRTDDFNQKTKRLLAQRVGYLCSNPECRAQTCGPCAQPDKIVTAGDAAHISAASPNGPRFDPSLSSEERRAYDNGIWLCVVHARVIDQDDSHYTVERLRSWKSQAEAHAMERLGKPQTQPTACSSDIRRFVALAKSVIAGLRAYTRDSSFVGIEGPLKQVEALAFSLNLPIPIEIRTIPYPEGKVPPNPFLQDRFEGRLTIRFPDGSFESGSAAHASGLELLIEARDSALVALEQWVLTLEVGEQSTAQKVEQTGCTEGRDRVSVENRTPLARRR